MITFDLHGLTTSEVLLLLKEIEAKNLKEVKLITGKGNHTLNRPTMDYFTSIHWKNPIKKVILDYIIYEKKEGALMSEFPAHIIWRRM